jgi:tetratricopeptide (TPR) repeat protein
MKNFIYTIAVFFPLTANAQAENKYIRQGNREYNKEQYEASEVSYRRANEENRRLPETIFNIGASLYKQEKYDEASKQFEGNVAMTEDISRKAAGLYNLGNSYLQSGKLQESIEAYKESLRLQPNSLEAKYNLAYAQDLLKEQDEQEQQQDQDQQNQNGDDQDNQNNENMNQSQQQQQEQQEGSSISREDAEQLLNSLANDEQKVQEKMRLERAAQERKKTLKNW